LSSQSRQILMWSAIYALPPPWPAAPPPPPRPRRLCRAASAGVALDAPPLAEDELASRALNKASSPATPSRSRLTRPQELAALGRGPGWRAALSRFEQLRAASPECLASVHVITTALSVAARHGERRFVDDTFAWMCGRGVAPTAHTFTALVVACGSDWRAALRRWAQAREAGAARSAHTLTAVLAACARGGAEGAAEAVPLFAWVEAARPTDGGADWAADAHLYTAFLQLFGRLGDAAAVQSVWSRAADALGREALAADAHAHCAYVTALTRCGGARAAARFFRSSPVPPSPFCYAAGLRSLAAAGRGLGEARAAWEEAAARGIPATPHLHAARLAVCVRHGAGAEALEALSEFQEGLPGGACEPPPAVCTHLAMAACARDSRLPDCLALLERLRAAGAADACSYGTAMLACALSIDPGRAEALLAQMAADGLAPNDYAFTALAAAHGACARREAEAGRGGAARAAARRARRVEARAAAAGIPPSVHLLNALLAAAEAAGEDEEAVRCFERARARGVRPNAATRALVEAVARRGRQAVEKQQVMVTQFSVAAGALAALLMQRGLM